MMKWGGWLGWPVLAALVAAALPSHAASLYIPHNKSPRLIIM